MTQAQLKRTQQPIESKPQMLCRQITALAHKLGPGARLPRVLEMARDFDVAPSTLNYALHEVEKRGLITRRRGSGVFVTDMATDQANQAHLALICRPTFFRAAGHSPLWDMLVQMIQERAAQSGVEFDCYFSREQTSEFPLPDALAGAIEEGNIRGVLGVGLPEGAARWIMTRGVPVVNLFSVGHTTVMTDATSVIRLSVEALRKRGCRRIGLWMPLPPPEPLKPGDNLRHIRTGQKALKESFLSALSSNGLAAHVELIDGNTDYLRRVPYQAPSIVEQGLETAQRVFSRDKEGWPDGLIIADDTMTRGALVALRQMKVDIENDLHIASQANVGSPTLVGETNLILAEIDPEEIVNTMFSHMDELIHRAANDLGEEKVVSIPARLRKISSQ